MAMRALLYRLLENCRRNKKIGFRILGNSNQLTTFITFLQLLRISLSLSIQLIDRAGTHAMTRIPCLARQWIADSQPGQVP